LNHHWNSQAGLLFHLEDTVSKLNMTANGFLEKKRKFWKEVRDFVCKKLRFWRISAVIYVNKRLKEQKFGFIEEFLDLDQILFEVIFFLHYTPIQPIFFFFHIFLYFSYNYCEKYNLHQTEVCWTLQWLIISLQAKCIEPVVLDFLAISPSHFETSSTLQKKLFYWIVVAVLGQLIFSSF
jgi:hypothetical protein